MFQCDINDAPVIGILGIVSHRAKVAAKEGKFLSKDDFRDVQCI